MLKKNTGNKNSSCKGYQSIGSFCFDGKMEDENSKCLNSTNIKTNEKVNDVGSHEHIIWEEDYNNLMNAYSICSKKSKSRDQIIYSICSQLPQFSTYQLLFKSQAPLWQSRNSNNLFNLYCRTVCSLKQKEIQSFLIQNSEGQFLLIKTKENNRQYLFEADTLALSIIKERYQFLRQLNVKLQKNKEANKLQQISKQILFLYKEYHNRKKQILEKIMKNSKIYDEFSQKIEQKMKQVSKSIKRIRKNRQK